MNRTRLLLGVAVACAVLSFVPTASADPPGAVGWWTQRPGAAPREDGGIEVASSLRGDESVAAIRIVDLACALAHRPSVLLLDEPSSGIAQRETEALGPVLLDIRDRTGAAIVVIEHDIPLVTAISDRLVAMELGAVIAVGEPDEVIGDPRVVSGYLGTDEAVVQRSGSKRKRRTLVAAR